jgi:hypothetical protein
MFIGFGGAAFLSELGVVRFDAELILNFLIPCFLFVLLCGIRDIIRRRRIRMPNHSTDPTPASFTPAAGQPPRQP